MSTSEQGILFLKTEWGRTVPVPALQGFGTKQILPPSVEDEYLVQKKIYSIAKSLKLSHLVSKPNQYFSEMFGLKLGCYSTQMIGKTEDLAQIPFVQRQNCRYPRDCPEYWSHVFQILSRDKKDIKTDFEKCYNELLDQLQPFQHRPSKLSLLQDAKDIAVLMTQVHKEGYVHGDLLGNVLISNHLCIIDPLGFRPGVHYEKGDTSFQYLVQIDQEHLVGLLLLYDAPTRTTLRRTKLDIGKNHV